MVARLATPGLGVASYIRIHCSSRADVQFITYVDQRVVNYIYV